MSYVQSIYHVVIRTYRSQPTIPIEAERDLYAYILGFCRNHNIRLIRIGGMPDHIHLLMNLPATMSIAQVVNQLKTASSLWLKANPKFPHFAGWSSGYAGLSCGYERVATISNYIARQKEHHIGERFADELRKLLAEQNVEIREEYFLKD